MKKMLFRSVMILTVFALALSSCKKKSTEIPQNPQDDNEKVTDVYLHLTDTTVTPHVVKTFAWKQMDVAISPVITSDTLTVGKNYIGSVLMLDRTKNPVDTLSHEFAEPELRLEHQFFYNVYPVNLAAFTYADTDKDANGVPVGIMPLVSAKAAGDGYFYMRLKHQPGIKPTSGNGDSSLGSMDIEIKFPFVIK